MVKGSQRRRSAYPIDSLFIDRWSPRALSGEALAPEQLMTLFEAARWAPSSNNNQPWRMLYAPRNSAHWPLFLGLLNERNQSWAGNAAALVLFISRTTFDDGRPAVTHAFDTGAAWENLALQASLLGLIAHGMQGFDYERARRELKVPETFEVNAMIAIGKAGDPALLPEAMRAREQPNDRRPLKETVCEGPFAF
jgi:nitroreductase